MKHIKIIIAIPTALLLLLAGTFFLLQIREVKVEGGKIYSDQEIVQTAMSDSYAYHTLYFFVKSKLGHVRCLPFTQEISVEWKSPFKIILHVYDKTISGCVKYMGQYIYFDKDGVVLQSLTEPVEGVPIVTGIKFGKFTLNEAFDVEDATLFDTIMNLSQLIHHYEVPVDQIKFDGKNVTLYSGKVEVSLGKKDFYDDAMAALASVLKKTNKKGLSGTIDLERFEPGSRIILKTNNAVQDTAGSEPEDGTESETTGEEAPDAAEGAETAGTEAGDGQTEDVGEGTDNGQNDQSVVSEQ